MKVVRAVINDNLSLRDATAQFNLPNESTVYQWVKRFQASGAGGALRPETRKTEKAGTRI
ncbi:helix-turn-helix domain-containing protein [Pantoea agglomerans]|uniref:helix-turn-helix domain-containing protein n=1 Tax=Enterobacter agglomerans TaxID=549 RepID=UPI003D178D70